MFAGLSIGFFTPRSVGDYFGRALMLESSKRFEVMGGLLVSRVSQTLVTVVMGVWVLLLFRKRLDLTGDFNFLLYICAFYFILILLLFFVRKIVIQKFMNFKRLRNVAVLFSIIKNYKGELYIRVILISILRYFSFLLQFILVAYMLDVHLEFVPFIAVVCILLLLKSVGFPLNFFSDLGARSTLAYVFFPLVGITPEVGVIIGLVVWVFNILVPSVFGSLIVWKAKW